MKMVIQYVKDFHVITQLWQQEENEKKLGNKH